MTTDKTISQPEAESRLADRIDKYEMYTHPHAELMADIAARLSARLGLSPTDTESIVKASLLHDIGLFAMSISYHTAAGPLGFEQRIDMWRHPIIGEQQMAKRGEPRHAQLLVRWHHEWWNGGGYPDMLSFEDIPIGARILRVAELFSALSCDRPYRQALDPKEIIEELRAAAGIECDPYIIKALFALIDEGEVKLPEPIVARPERPAFIPPETLEQQAPSDQNVTDGLEEPSLVPPPSLGDGQEPAAVVSASEPEIEKPEQLIETPETPKVAGPPLTDWTRSGYNRKTLLGFEASVLRQVEFNSIAIPFCGRAQLDWYVNAWGRSVFSNDPRAWAGACSRALLGGGAPLDEEKIIRILEDAYVPGAKMSNPSLRRFFNEIDALFMDNLRKNIESMSDGEFFFRALYVGLQTGEYALSFNPATSEFRLPLTFVFRKIAMRSFDGFPSRRESQFSNISANEFIRLTNADLMFFNLPSALAEKTGSSARTEWRESWVWGHERAEIGEIIDLTTAPQSKEAYLAVVDSYLKAAWHFPKWAIEYQDAGLATAHDISELIKKHRTLEATYSKDMTEVAGGLRTYIMIARKN